MCTLRQELVCEIWDNSKIENWLIISSFDNNDAANCVDLLITLFRHRLSVNYRLIISSDRLSLCLTSLPYNVMLKYTVISSRPSVDILCITVDNWLIVGDHWGRPSKNLVPITAGINYAIVILMAIKSHCPYIAYIISVGGSNRIELNAQPTGTING